MRYGRQVTLSNNGGVMEVKEKVYANYETVKEVHAFHETVRVTDDKEILAIFLKLLDDQAAGKIDQIGLQCIRNQDNGSIRVEKTWVVQ